MAFIFVPPLLLAHASVCPVGLRAHWNETAKLNYCVSQLSERETHTDTDTERETETDRQRDRQTDTQKERGRKNERVFPDDNNEISPD